MVESDVQFSLLRFTHDQRHGSLSPFYRHGQNPKGHDRLRNRDCRRVFQLTYAYKPGVKEQTTEMAFNGAGGRDTARALKVDINTVIRT